MHTPQVTLLNFGPEHAASYNELVEVIRRNLLLADWCDDEHREVGASARVCVCVCVFVCVRVFDCGWVGGKVRHGPLLVHRAAGVHGARVHTHTHTHTHTHVRRAS